MEKIEITSDIAFAFTFGALDMLANLKPKLANDLEHMVKDMFRLSFPNKTFEDYRLLIGSLQDEKENKIAPKLNGLLMEKMGYK